MDFFIDNMVKKSICNIIDKKDTILDNKAIWFSYTKLMFKNFPGMEVWKLVEQASEEASDEFWFEHKYSEEDFKKKFIEKKPYKRKEIGKDVKNIASKISILELADRYNLRPLGKPKRICPFHLDKDPSLSLNEEKGIFKCFGCSASGNIIKFKAMMDKLRCKDGNKQRTI